MKRQRLGAFLLLMILMILGHVTPHQRPTHGNEGNNMTGAWLVSQGAVVYRDFFTHHPPFAYWFAAPLVRLLGRGEAVFHAAALLFCVLALAFLQGANRRSAQPFSFGLFVLFVALGHVIYWGHLYLADMFPGFGLLIVFCHFWRYDEKNAMFWRDWLMVGLAMFISLGSSLVAAYALVLLACGLAVKYFRFAPRRGLLLRAAGSVALAATPFAAAAVYLWATGSLRPLYEHVYLGSIRHYRMETGYAHLAPGLSPLLFFLQNLREKLVIFILTLELGNGAVMGCLAWANVGVAVWLVASRRWFMACFYPAYVATLMLRVQDQYAAPFAIQSFWAAAFLFQPAGRRIAEVWRAFRRKALLPAASCADILGLAGASVFLAVLAQNYMGEIVMAPPPVSPERDIAELCAALTLPGETIAALPCSPDIYRWAGRKPGVPAYTYFMWQERDAALRRRMIASFEQQKPTLVVINWWMPAAAGQYAFATYAEELRDALRRNYQQLSIGIPTIYARNASYQEMLGRYEAVRPRPVLEAPERNALPLSVFGPVGVTQYFTVNDRVASAGLELLVSAPRRTDAVAGVELGFVGSDGDEKTLVRDSFRTAVVRYYPGTTRRTFWQRFSLVRGGILKPGRRYFFRVTAPGADVPEALQVWSSPRTAREGIGETLYGGGATSRTVCFKLSGTTKPGGLGVYPLVEQSLARTSLTITSAGVRQTLTLPEATTVSAVSLLLGGDGKTTGPAGCRFELLGKAGKALSSQTMALPRTGREWTTFAVPPVILRRGERLTIALRADRDDAGSPLRAWSAGCKLYAGGELTAGGAPREDDLCFRLYERNPAQAGLPDVAVSNLSFDPAAPVSIAPGAPVRLTVRLENRGTAPARPFWIEFLALPRDFSAAQSFLCESFNLPGLKPGEAFEQTLTRRLNPLPDGLYTVSVLADRINEVAESSKENNRLEAAGRELLVVARGTDDIDLFVNEFKLEREPVRRGGPLEMRGVVSNLGKKAAGHFVIEFWAAPDPDQRLLRVPAGDPIVVESLAPNAVIDLAQYPRTLRSDLPTGRLYLSCTVDARDEVAETSKWNNTAATGPVMIEP